MADSRKFFLLALLIHLLLLFLFAVVLNDPLLSPLYQPYYEKLPQKEYSVLPAYFAPQIPTKNQQTLLTQKPLANDQTSENGLEKPKQTQTTTAMTPSQPLAYHAGSDSEASSAKETTRNELLTLLHEATGRKLVYPRMGQDFHVTGTVHVRFIILPDGQVSHVSVVKSSGFGPFDEAASTAIRNISPVAGVGLYIKKPEVVVAVISFK